MIRDLVPSLFGEGLFYLNPLPLLFDKNIMKEYPIETFRNLEKHMSQSLLILDLKGIVIYTSQHVAEDLNISGEMLQRDFRSLFDGVNKHQVNKFIREICQKNIGKSQLNIKITKNSKNRWIQLRSKVVFNDDHQPFYISISLENITFQKYQKLKNQELVKRLQNIEGLSHTGTWKYDSEVDAFDWSDEVYLMHDVSKELPVSFKSFLDFYYPYDQGKIEDAFTSCREDGKSFDLQVRLIRANKEVSWVRLTGSVSFSNGKAAGVHGLIKDISTQKSLEYSLENEVHKSEQYREMLDSFAIVAQTDLKGKITYVNDKFCEISQYSREELIGKDHRIVNSGHHPSDFFKDLWDCLRSGNAWYGEIKNKAKDGSYYWVDSYLTPLKDKNGIMTGFMAMRIDITKEKEMDNIIKEERERATLSNQLASVGEMSAGIVHEINNPLSIIAGMNAILPKRIGNEEGVLKIHNAINKSVERINHIINGLKRLSHKGTQQEREIIPLIDLLEDSLSFIKESLNYRHIEFELGDMPIDVVLECHEVEISQVLLNLVNNARDAILELDPPEKWIKVHFENQTDYLEIRVMDSGPGIPEEIQDKIMEQFFTTKKVGKGTGLGLSLSSRIIRDHGGKLYLDKEAPHTTFVIVLPKKLDAIAA